MSKLAATPPSRCRIHLRRLLAAGTTLILTLPAVLVAGPADPALQRTEQIDMRRLGTVPEDERSVLRIEWRVAATSTDEARTVQDMLDSLRRMQGTLGEINRLISGIPAPGPVAQAAAAEPDKPAFDDKTMAIAGAVAIGLLALWWSRRREPTAPPATPPVATAPAKAHPPGEAKTVETLPLPGPTHIAPAKPKQAEAPAPERSGTSGPSDPSALPATAGIPVVDFSLEEADPEVAAREMARLEKLRALDHRKTPEQAKDSNVEPTLELAGIMLSLGLEQGATETLIEYINANPRQALRHSLKLLDIYRSSGHRKDFKEAAEKLRQNFNIQAEDWLRESAAEAPTLEGFSRLSQHIQDTWSRPAECISYLQNLLEDNREGTRAGFPWPVAEEILLLIDILKETSGTVQAT